MKEFLKKVVIKVLIFESKLVLKKYKPKIIAITGSVGKTSTKDAIYAMLSRFVYVRKSEKSYNSQIGLPLTILGLGNAWGSPLGWLKNIFAGFWLVLSRQKYPEWLVLEVGVGKPGDMRETASWLLTDVVVMTAIGETPVHVEFFDSREHLIREKSELIVTLKKEGFLILNADDEDIFKMKEKAKRKTFTYGFSVGSTVQATNDVIFFNQNIPKGVTFKVEVSGGSLPVLREGVFGRNHIYSTLASITVAHALELSLLEAIDALKNYQVPPGRMCLIAGIHNSYILDDTYNSSPYACQAALETLGSLPEVAGRKIAVLGDMLELGKYTLEAHKNMGKVVKENADILVVVGPRAQGIKDGAIDAGMDTKNIFEFSNSWLAGEFLTTFVSSGDVVLVKGSQGVRMERTVEAIMLEKDKKAELLVRQDSEWLQR